MNRQETAQALFYRVQSVLEACDPFQAHVLLLREEGHSESTAKFMAWTEGEARFEERMEQIEKEAF